MRFIPEIIFIAVIALYSLFITRIVPKKYYSFSNILIALGAIAYALSIGLSTAQLGLSLDLLKKGLALGTLLSLPIIIIILLLASQKSLRKHFGATPEKNYNLRFFAHELFFRIPFGTAFSEEVIFRCVLLAILLSNHPRPTAIIVSSLLFGLWHIFPTLHTAKNRDPLIEMMDDTRKRNTVAVITSVLATTVAGFIFTLITIKAGSFVASWLVHCTINGFATAGGYLVVWYGRRQRN